MLNWTKQFNIFCLLDNNQYNFSDPQFECLLAAGSIKTLQPLPGSTFNEFQNFVQEQKDWVFGHLAYDLKNEIENLSSQNFDGIQFPDMFFFVPEFILILKEDALDIGIINGDPGVIHQNILSSAESHKTKKQTATIKSRFSKDEYLETVRQIQQHILRGD